MNEFFALGITMAVQRALAMLGETEGTRFADDLTKVGGQHLEQVHMGADEHEPAPKSWSRWLQVRAVQFDSAMSRSYVPSDFMVPTAFSTGYFDGIREFAVKTAVSVALMSFMDALAVRDPAAWQKLFDSWAAEQPPS